MEGKTAKMDRVGIRGVVHRMAVPILDLDPGTPLGQIPIGPRSRIARPRLDLVCLNGLSPGRQDIWKKRAAGDPRMPTPTAAGGQVGVLRAQGKQGVRREARPMVARAGGVTQVKGHLDRGSVMVSRCARCLPMTIEGEHRRGRACGTRGGQAAASRAIDPKAGIPDNE